MMPERKICKYPFNPVTGLSVAVVCIILLFFTNSVLLAFSVSIVYALTIDFCLTRFTRNRISGFIFSISIVPLLVTLLLRVALERMYIPDIFYLLFFEVMLVVVFTLSHVLRSNILAYLNSESNGTQELFYADFKRVSKIVRYALTTHLFVCLLYTNVSTYFGSSLLDIALFYFSPAIMLVFIILYEMFRSKLINNQIGVEEWLPIVSESGKISGRIAKSESLLMKNKFMHPVVRIAVIDNGHIYLKERNDNDSFSSGAHDHPFEKYLLLNQEINEAASDYVSDQLGDHGFRIHFLLKYVYENQDTRRLIYLFFVRPETEEQKYALRTLNGEFWDTDQIESNFEDENFFCECFELEYEYIKNMVLKSDDLFKSTNM